MKKYLTIYRALNFQTREIETFFGEEIFANSWEEAERILIERDLRHLTIQGEYVGTITTDEPHHTTFEPEYSEQRFA